MEQEISVLSEESAVVGPRPGPGADPEVVARARRRRFRAEYKLQILEQADACSPGEVGALLRREGLYSSHLTSWRKQRREGTLGALGKKRGRKVSPKREQDKRVKDLERENRRLKKKLAEAEYLLEIQKKVASIAGIPLPNGDSDEDE